LFHAGDLNNWHGKEHGSKVFTQTMERDFLAELSRIANEVPRMDLAMFPVDPRLGPGCGLGARQLMQAIQVGALIPIHFSTDEREPFRYRDAHPEQNVVALTEPGQTYEF